ncbi:hypothetical protein ACX6XY_07010 [Streptomyces sp. O3]
MNQSAEPGTVFAPDCFDSQTGRTVPLRVEGLPEGTEATVVAAAVAGDGTSVDLTLDVPAELLPSAPVRPGAFSLG